MDQLMAHSTRLPMRLEAARNSILLTRLGMMLVRISRPITCRVLVGYRSGGLPTSTTSWCWAWDESELLV